MNNKMVNVAVKKIGLGIITHQRPEGLRALLESLAQIKIPHDSECVVLIAENDDEPSMADLIDKISLPFSVRYELEQRRGIPFARNHVLDMALEEGCEYLTFVDDDAIVHKDWLIVLHNALVGRGADLAGGPAVLEPVPSVSLNWQNRMVLRHFKAVNKKVLRSYTMRVATEREQSIEICTHNWMLRLSKQRETGIRFDETLRYTGGSDRKFFLDIREKGATTVWASDARVFELWPPARLTLGYLYRRVRDQQTMRLIADNSVPGQASALLHMMMSSLKTLWLVLLAPLKRFRTLPKAVRTMAIATGRVRAARGQQSTLYAPEGANKAGLSHVTE